MSVIGVHDVKFPNKKYYVEEIKQITVKSKSRKGQTTYASLKGKYAGRTSTL